MPATASAAETIRITTPSGDRSGASRPRTDPAGSRRPRLDVDEPIRSVGDRDVGPLEARPGVGRAGDHDLLVVDDLADRPRLEVSLALARGSIDERHVLATFRI